METKKGDKYISIYTMWIRRINQNSREYLYNQWESGTFQTT